MIIYVEKNQTLTLKTDEGQTIKKGFKDMKEVETYINKQLTKRAVEYTNILTKKELEKD